MSKNVKIIIIISGILAFLAAACAGGVFYLGSFVDDGAVNGLYEGREYGKTTDNAGCQTKIVEMLETVKDSDMKGTLTAAYYLDGCLETSRPTPNFCDGAVNPYGDIFNDDKGKDAECEKLGLKGSIPCRFVIDKKLDYCMSKK